ncbi:MAG: UvrB/UvrC motif-containing protein [Isosphaeraceae bacterium]
MSKDITHVLAGWDYEPDDVQVRIVTGDDGRDKLQTRLDLGVLQMELVGRPDGTRPNGHESLLDAHEDRARAAQERGEPYVLDSRACAALMREGYQYYQRYLAAFHIQRYDLVMRDTARNLRLFEFVVRHAGRQRDKLKFDQYRPYVLMMNSRARASMALATNDYAAALALIDEGVEAIRAFLREYNQADNEAECAELGSLLRWRREVESERPVGPIERLEQQLALAVALEEYEEAARLRDQLQRLRGPVVGPLPEAH